MGNASAGARDGHDVPGRPSVPDLDAPHETALRVRYVETDAMGVCHHASYIAFLEVGRTEWLRARGRSYRELEDMGVRLAVVDLEARYLASARYDDPLIVTTWLVEVGGASLRFRYEIRCDGKLLVRAMTRLGAIDANGRPQRLPAELRTLDPARR